MKAKDANNKLYWRRLDNSAKIFPISAGKKYSTVFRISCVLKEEVKEKLLQEAVEKALEQYPFFKVRMKPGIFWNYLEHNPKKPIIKKEDNFPCKYIDKRDNNEYLFKVTYYKNKINIDIFHVLTDGNGGGDFFKEIIYTYLELSHPEKFKEEIRVKKKIEFNAEDSYMKNYNKKLKGNNSSKKAYVIKGRKLPLGAVNATHEIINIEQLKKVSEENGVTITQYLTAVLIYSIYKTNYAKNKSKKPIKVCIPVNLKKYFKSITMSNFFSYITLEAEMYDEKMPTFDKILQFVKQDFQKRLTIEEINKTMSGNVKLGNNPAIRIIPLFLKKIFVRIAYLEIRKYTTITFSNIGRMGIIGKYKNYIENCAFLIAPEPVEKIKCTACTFENKLTYTFTSILRNKDIEKYFYEFIKQQQIEIIKENKYDEKAVFQYPKKIIVEKGKNRFKILGGLSILVLLIEIFSNISFKVSMPLVAGVALMVLGISLLMYILLSDDKFVEELKKKFHL